MYQVQTITKTVFWLPRYRNKFVVVSQLLSLWPSQFFSAHHNCHPSQLFPIWHFLIARKALALPHNALVLLEEAAAAALCGNAGKLFGASTNFSKVPCVCQSSSSMTVYPPPPFRAPMWYRWRPRLEVVAVLLDDWLGSVCCCRLSTLENWSIECIIAVASRRCNLLRVAVRAGVKRGGLVCNKNDYNA